MQLTARCTKRGEGGSLLHTTTVEYVTENRTPALIGQ